MDTDEQIEAAKFMLDTRLQQEQLGQLKRIAQSSKGQARSGASCPRCGGPIPSIGVSLCMHCRHALSWVQGIPCKPGGESNLRNSLWQAASEQQYRSQQQATQAIEFEKRLISITVAISVGFLGAIVPVFFSSATSQDKVFAGLFLGSIGAPILCWSLFRRRRVLGCDPEIKRKAGEKAEEIKRKADEKRWEESRKESRRSRQENAIKELRTKSLKHLQSGNVNLACEKLSDIFLGYPGTTAATEAKEIYSAERSADKEYKLAKNLYKRRNYGEAIRAFQSIVQQFPGAQGAIRATKILESENQSFNLYQHAAELHRLGKTGEVVKVLADIGERFPKTRSGRRAKSMLSKKR